ncbi:MAG: glycosyltransferase family 2 protein [Tannerellaceae bacterium]|jgi:hypothetical protein|nr:glycosyltransferase family 2 protein [Tannerellaceae bacterium]
MGNLFKQLKIYLQNIYIFLRGKINPSKIVEGKEIPIIINNYNRLSTLKKLIDSLMQRGYANIYIIDNQSTYPPLLQYYTECPFPVFKLKENLGFKALWKSDLRKKFCTDYYIYTDSDVVPADYCPGDFIDYFLKILKERPFARKAGFSLRIDNLPDRYNNKEKVVQWENQFYKKPVNDKLYRAPIDTTFALYRPYAGLSRSRYVETYRTAYPYQAEHLPWYVDTNNMSEEEKYYISHCTQKTGWSEITLADKK